jgi:hypothetical protein
MFSLYFQSKDLIPKLVIMIIRVYALYGRSPYVLGFLMVLWTAQIIISSIGMKTGFREYGVDICA